MIFVIATDGGSVGYAGVFADHIGGCGKKTPYPPLATDDVLIGLLSFFMGVA